MVHILAYVELKASQEKGKIYFLHSLWSLQNIKEKTLWAAVEQCHEVITLLTLGLIQPSTLCFTHRLIIPRCLNRTTLGTFTHKSGETIVEVVTGQKEGNCLIPPPAPKKPISPCLTVGAVLISYIYMNSLQFVANWYIDSGYNPE